jgi:hypothetical protein
MDWWGMGAGKARDLGNGRGYRGLSRLVGWESGGRPTLIKRGWGTRFNVEIVRTWGAAMLRPYAEGALARFWRGSCGGIGRTIVEAGFLHAEEEFVDFG